MRDAIVFDLAQQFCDASYDLSAVYLQGIDTGSHAWTDAVFGRNINKVRPKRMAEAEAHELWNRLVREAYRTMDTRLGNVLASLAPQDVLLIVSDHGWRYDGTSHWNRPEGTVLLYGALVRPGVRFYRASVYDILPTMVALLGLPLSGELSGQVMSSAFVLPQEGGTLDLGAVPRIGTYGRRHQALSVTPTATDEGHLEKLRSLGYIE